tara:strand:+ start:1104 stop:1469 length:366 start_codon:yes stop_codon:yes gene_type:complete
MEIVLTQYNPIFDDDLDIYTDKLPFTPNSRYNTPQWCPCRPNKVSFNTNTLFKKHIASLTHKEWLKYLDQPSPKDKEIRSLKKEIIKKDIELVRIMLKFNKLKLYVETDTYNLLQKQVIYK